MKKLKKIFSSLIFILCFVNISAAQNNITPYIIGGTPANSGDFPFIVSLLTNSGSTFYHFCGGSLIDKRWVLTAAHCVAGTGTIKVRANSLDSTTGGEVVDVIERYVHPSYSTSTLFADLALLKLSRDVTSVAPVRLASSTENAQLVANTSVSVAGWGYTSNSQQVTSRFLMKVNVPVVAQNICNTAYDDSIFNEMVCAGTVGKDSCNGDSGGPLVFSDSSGKYLVGIVSFGPTQCGSSTPGVYTRVFSFLSWINQTLGDVSTPGTFNILSPGFDQRLDTKRPTITWSSSANALSYRLLVQNISTLAITSYDTTNTSYTFTSNLAPARYAFKILALNGDLQTSSIISAFYVNLDRAVISPLSANYSNRRPTVSWSAVSGALNYRIYFRNITSGGILDITNINGTSYTPTSDLISGAYEVHVLAHGSIVNSSWSAAGRFSINFSAPNNISASSTSRRPTISWTAVAGAPAYEVYIKNSTNTSNILIGRSTTTSYVPSRDLLPGNNDVWVRVATPQAITVWSSPTRFVTR